MATENKLLSYKRPRSREKCYLLSALRAPVSSDLSFSLWTLGRQGTTGHQEEEESDGDRRIVRGKLVGTLNRRNEEYNQLGDKLRLVQLECSDKRLELYGHSVLGPKLPTGETRQSFPLYLHQAICQSRDGHFRAYVPIIGRASKVCLMSCNDGGGWKHVGRLTMLLIWAFMRPRIGDPG